MTAERNPEKLTVDQIKGYRCLSDEEFEALEEGSKQLAYIFYRQHLAMKFGIVRTVYEYYLLHRQTRKDIFCRNRTRKTILEQARRCADGCGVDKENSWADGARVPLIEMTD